MAIRGDRIGRVAALRAAAALSTAGLGALALGSAPATLGAAALFGMVNGMGRDRGPAQTLEQSLLADGVADTERTAVFARYALVQDAFGALGSLAAGLPAVLQRIAGWGPVVAAQWTFGGTAALCLVPVALYARITESTASAAGRTRDRTRVSAGTARRVAGLTGLFALDSLGGGFLAGSIVTYWFFRRFGLSGDVLGPLFFAGRILNGASYYAADFLARRIGLIRTMVFTHLPSSLVLLALPFAASAPVAMLLFLVRESLVQMDVPTRQAYVAAVTRPSERTFALGVTGLARNVGWAVGPALAGTAIGAFSLGAPLVAGAGLKIVYDLALFGSYRRVGAPGNPPLDNSRYND